MSKPLRLVVFASGNGSNFQAIQDAILNNELNAKIKTVVSDQKDAYVLTRASNHNLESKYFTYSKEEGKELFEKRILNYLKGFEFDYIVCAGYMRIIGSTLLGQYEQKIINIHPSKLPLYKGLDALGQALSANDKEIGVSVHYVDETLDGGALIDQCVFPIDDSMTRLDIETLLHKHEHKLYVDVLKRLQKRENSK